jgi:hypothetical protein
MKPMLKEIATYLLIVFALIAFALLRALANILCRR